jgi:hypothetical protein
MSIASRLYPTMADRGGPAGVTLNDRTIAGLDAVTLVRISHALTHPIPQQKPAAKADAKYKTIAAAIVAERQAAFVGEQRQHLARRRCIDPRCH